ncbi:TPA: glycosyltransferase family 4 protein [Photobacterium damselae]
MKVLIVNTKDIDGGAARAAYRLHTSLINNKVDSEMLVLFKDSDDFTVNGDFDTKNKIINKIRPTLDLLPTRKYHNRTLFSTSWFQSSNIVNKINEIKPDIVHLHWINAGMIKIEDLLKIKAPIVWSLHDMWAFTGGCHYDEECGKYKEKCGKCIVLKSDKSKDISNKIIERKKKTYSNINNITIVGLSRWIQESALNSVVFKNKKVINLPNPINTEIYRPFDKIKARELWGLPKNKKLVLFGAMGATSDYRKGFNELSKALESINGENIEFVVFGASRPRTPPDNGCKTHYLGRLTDDLSLVTLYSAVDVMVVPSLQENLSNAIMESLACATPVIAFNIGGNSDLIEHKRNGYLAVPFNSLDLAYGIKLIINSKDYDSICLNAIDKVRKEFDSNIVAKKYIDLYKDILANS